jgi:hypothetical protein
MTLGIYNSNAFRNAAGVQVVPNANVEVRRESDSGLADIFADRAGASQITQVAYPGTTGFQADADGYFEFFAAGISGGYQIRVYSDDLSLDKTIHYQATGTGRERDASDYGATIMDAANAAAARALLDTLSAAQVGSGAFSILNGYLDWTVSGNALTAAIKTWAGADPSAADPVYIAFRDPTAATGLPLIRKLIGATSVTASSGSTLGTINSTAFRLWCVAFDDGGTVRLGLINCLSGTAPSLNIYPLAGWGIASSTAEGGAGAADSAAVFYTGAAVTDKAYSVLGYATWESGLATAGTWSAGPTRKQLFGVGVPLPGQTVQMQRTQTGAVATGTTVLPNDDTIPQNTEGNEYMTRAITPTSAANLLSVESIVNLTNNATGQVAAALFQDSTANALAAVGDENQNSSAEKNLRLHHNLRASTTSSTEFKVRAGNHAAGTTTFNGQAGARIFGGVFNSFLQATEIMA